MTPEDMDALDGLMSAAEYRAHVKARAREVSYVPHTPAELRAHARARRRELVTMRCSNPFPRACAAVPS